MHVHDMPLLSTSSALLHFACLWPLVGCVLYAVITDLSSVKPSYFKVNQVLSLSCENIIFRKPSVISVKEYHAVLCVCVVVLVAVAQWTGRRDAD